MATVRIQKNILEENLDTFSVEEGITIEQLIRENTDGDSYNGTLVECYDLETGKTYFAPLEDNVATTNAIVQVNGKDVGLDYKVKKDDIVGIIITPAGGGGGGWDWTGAFAGGLAGAFTGALYGSAFNLGLGTLIGAIAGFVVGFVGGGLLVGSIKNQMISKDPKASKGIDSKSLPDVRGATNQPLLDQTYPFVLGKHLVNPFIIGSPYNNFSGDHGQHNYIQVLYAVGYAPLRLTDFKLGDMFIAHNQRWYGNQNMKNVFHGTLYGTDSSASAGSDTGDIANIWKNNDVTIEILQQDQNGGLVDYGYVYPYAKIQTEIGANVLYIADGTLSEIASADSISYKGLGLKNGMRNNPIRFTEQFPKSARVELDFPNGLFKTRSETEDDESTVKYAKIPMWVAIQWRVFSEDNAKADGESGGELAIPTYDYVTKSYTSTLRGWNSFHSVNNGIYSTPFTSGDRDADCDAHTGNNLSREEEVEHIEQYQEAVGVDNKTGETIYETGSRVVKEKRTVRTEINNGWIGSKVFNFQSLGGSNDEEDGIHEFRCITTVDFVEWARENLLTQEERNLGDETILAEKYRAYFLDGSNTTKSVEIRVVRVSPCYLDETVSTKEHSAYTFNDVFTWNTLTSEMLDSDALDNNRIVQQRPLDEEKMRKLCIVSLRAKTDTVDQLSNTIKKFSCIAQSFAPYYDSVQKKWFPESVKKITRYYKPSVEIEPRVWVKGQEISQAQFYEDRQNGIKSISCPSGNDYVPNMVNNVIKTNSHIDERGRYYIPNDDKDQSGNYLPGCDGTLNYCTNIVSSMFLLAGVGPLLGVDALGYEQNFYDSETGELKKDFGDFNLSAIAKWNEELKELKDGSFYTTDGYHYNERGDRIRHLKGEEVKIFFSANAYLYQSEVLENILAKISIAGRAVYTKDNKGRLTVVMDKPEKYPVALLNQQNTIKSSYSISFAELPSGIQLSFPDENDGYQQNQFYCMADGENAENPRGAIEQYNFSYVTNPYQQNSLGRYLLANRILNREIVTKQIGPEGASVGLGNLVLVSDDTMLIGTDQGGRITKLIENENLIYGFVINGTYHYTGEEEEVDGVLKSKQGVVVLQPKQYQESRVITIRLARRNSAYIVDGVTYRARKGNTNIVLFDTPIAKTQDSQTLDGTDYYIYKPEVDNIVSFGIIGQITSTYRVTKIKADAKGHYEFTLMKYQEDLYNYGRALPSFQNNMTVPDRSGEDSFALSENVTHAELIKVYADASELAQGRIDSTFGNQPPAPSNLVASVKEDCIQFTCSVDERGINNVDHIVYEVTKYRPGNDGPEEKISTIEGSYSTEYFFDRLWEGYPEKKAAGVTENDGSLNFWKFRAKAIGIYIDSNGNRLESEWSDYIYLSPASLAEYGTWIPPVPSRISFVAVEDGINASWTCNLDNVYGTTRFVITPYYVNTPRSPITVPTKNATYQFDRSVDGYPEKDGQTGVKLGTLIINNYGVIISAVNVQSGNTSTSEKVMCDVTQYKTWIPSNPVVSARISNRNITLYMSTSNDSYGLINYLVGVRRYDDDVNDFFVPDLSTNPYARETAYKLLVDNTFILGHLESESQYNQTMPLKTQSGIASAFDYDEDRERNKAIIGKAKAGGGNKVLILPRGGFAPVDTSYQFEVYAYNKTVENYYDTTAVQPHNYDIETYHKVSAESAKSTVVALATSVQDILNGAINSDKIGTGAITETKIEDGAISTPKIKTNAVQADSIYTYNLITLSQGTHAISGFAPDTTSDTYIEQLIYNIKNAHEVDQQSNIQLLDAEIKRRSTNYWIGLDTAHPEFYMGNVVVSEKHREEANYFHYYPSGNETNLDIKLSNFIVTAISSTIKGYFNVRNKNGNTKYVGSNSFLQVNPEFDSNLEDPVEGYYYNGSFYSDSAHTQIIAPDSLEVYKDVTVDSESGLPVGKYYQFNGTEYVEVQPTDGESILIKGDVTIGAKNYLHGGQVQNGKLLVLGSSEVGSLKVNGSSTFDGASTFNAAVTLSANSSLTSKGSTNNFEKHLKVGTNNTKSATFTADASGTIFQIGSFVKLSYTNPALEVGIQNSPMNAKIWGTLTVEQTATISGNTYINGSLSVDTIVPKNLGYITMGHINTGNVTSNGTVRGALVTGSRMKIPNGRPAVVETGDMWVV